VRTRTILHETVHAKIYSLLREAGGFNQTGPLNFPLLWEAWLEATRTHASTDQAANRAHHSYMATQYVTALAQALQAWDTRNHGNLNVTLEDYTAMAWEGLEGSYVWELKTPTEQEGIRKTRRDFLNLYGYYQ
jgi:hypothetical protein